MSRSMPEALRHAVSGAILSLNPAKILINWPGSIRTGIRGQVIRTTINHLIEGLDFQQAVEKASAETKNQYLAAAFSESSVERVLLDMLVTHPFLEVLQRYLETDLPSEFRTECVLGEPDDGEPGSLEQVVNTRLLSSLVIGFVQRHGATSFSKSDLHATVGQEMIILTEKGEVRVSLKTQPPVADPPLPVAAPAPPPSTNTPQPYPAPGEKELSQGDRGFLPWMPRQP